MNATAQIVEAQIVEARLVVATGAPRSRREQLSSNPRSDAHSELLAYFETLSGALGPMHWWPARTRFEVIVGAILTQNTAWSNVERALINLRRERLLTPLAMERVSSTRLAQLVRPSGCYRQKTRKLKEFVKFLRREYGGSLRRMFRTPTLTLREQLLAVHGIGPETADSILLYAGGHAIFVVDAYTHRILERHGLHAGKPDYRRIQALVEFSLPREPRAYNEFHALLVKVGKRWCRTKNPRCEECPLRAHLPVDSPAGRELLARNGYCDDHRDDHRNDHDASSPLLTFAAERPA